jgi:hypothetical protein
MENNEKDPIKELSDAIEAKGLKVVFGLEQQGHIQHIQKRLNDFGGWSYHAWREIGKEIGWEPLTAACHYHQYLSERNNYQALKEENEELKEIVIKVLVNLKQRCKWAKSEDDANEIEKEIKFLSEILTKHSK